MTRPKYPRLLMNRIAMIVALALFGMAPLAQALPWDHNPKLLLHLKALTVKNQCTTWGNLTDCNMAVTNGQVATPIGPFYYVYLLAASGDLRSMTLGGNDKGVAGLQCGIQYDGQAASGVDVFSWQLCATLQFPGGSAPWPAPGSGNLITWDPATSCQLGEVGIAGYFYCGAYSPDVLQLTVRPVDHLAAVADCAAAQYPLTEADLGNVRFTAVGMTSGCNPCISSCAPPVPTETVSWSRIKGQYASQR